MMKKRLKKLGFILPGVLGTFLFYLLPLVYCAVFSFSGASGRFRFVGAANFGALRKSETFCLALVRTYGQMLVYVGIILILSLVLVYCLDGTERNLLLLLGMSLPMLLPPAVIVKFAEGSEGSPVLLLLMIFLWKYLGFHVLLLKVAERTMPQEWVEAAVLEKAAKRQVYSLIKLPFLWPYLRFLIIFDGISFFRLFRESYLMYGPYPPKEVYMITNFFFNNFQNLNYQRLAAAAVVSMLPVLLFHGCLLKVGGRNEMV